MNPYAALLAALACTFPMSGQAARAAPQPRPVAFGIVPGKNAGRLALGATSAEIRKVLGKPRVSHRGPNGLTAEEWSPRADDARPAYLVLYRGGKAVQIEVASPRFSTAEGVNSQTTLREIRRRYPHLTVREYRYEDWFELYFDDTAAGIAFFIGGQDFIEPQYHPEAVIVHPAGTRVVPHFGGKPMQVTDDHTK